MNRIRVSALVLVGAATLAASCGSVDPMSDTELAECRDAADAVNGATSIGGSSVLISVPAVLLPDVVIPPAATPAEMEAAYDEAYREIYKISVDELLALRADADAPTTARLGEPPGIGEHVSADEWFAERDTELMRLWNERHPESVKAFCDLVQDGTRETS